jgi:hypothetical protein
LPKKVTICPLAVLAYVASSRVDGTAHSPERIVVSFGGIGSWWPTSQTAGSKRFCIHEFWWVQDNAGTFSTLYAFSALLMERGRKRKKVETAFWWTRVRAGIFSDSLLELLCGIKNISNLKVRVCTLVFL